MLAVGAALVFVSGTSSAVSVCLRSTLDCAPRLEVSIEARISPRMLLRRQMAPAGFGVSGRIGQGDAHPSALREMEMTVDKDVQVDVRGLPVCKGERLDTREMRDPRELRRVCRKAILGSGEAEAMLSFPGHAPIPVSSRLTVFNGGVRGRSRTLFVHGVLWIPVPQAVVAKVELRRLRHDGLGWRASVQIPSIAGGSGSLMAFRLNLKRFFSYRGEHKSFLSARCPDGHFKLKMPKLLFRNEARVPNVPSQTVLKGSLLIPCTPKS